ncbi:MAG: ATP-binding protein [Thermoproteota archaeon]
MRFRVIITQDEDEHYVTEVPAPPVINALLHRNYSLEADVKIFKHKDRIRIRSPGGLMPGVNLDEPEHVPRNPVLCQLMFDIGYIEKYGYGIRMMRDTTKAHPVVKLHLNTDTFRFNTLFPKEKYFSIVEDLQENTEHSKRRPESILKHSQQVGLSKQATIL